MLRRIVKLTAAGAFLSTAASRRIDELRTPCLVLYRSVLERNAAVMRDRSTSLGCVLRPHFKTVKTLEGALIATGGKKRRITVSTLAEASFLADGGWDDILYAVPLTPDKIDDVLALHERLDAFTVMVDHPAQVEALLCACESRVHKPLRVVVGVDCGYHRDGVDPEDPTSLELVRELCSSEATSFAGLYTHGGHSYDATTPSEVAEIAVVERDVTVRFAEKLRAEGVSVPSVGIGSTPTCARPPEHLRGVDEMHPGNYLYCARASPREATDLQLGMRRQPRAWIG